MCDVTWRVLGQGKVSTLNYVADRESTLKTGA